MGHLLGTARQKAQVLLLALLLLGCSGAESVQATPTEQLTSEADAAQTSVTEEQRPTELASVIVSNGPCSRGDFGDYALWEYVGLTVEEAHKLANRNGESVALDGVDGDCLPQIAYAGLINVNLDVVDGIVVFAHRG